MNYYKTEIPNIIYHLGLSAHEISLYSVIKRAAGDEEVCCKGTSALAEESGMSRHQVSDAKKYLTRRHPILQNKPLIRVEERYGEDGEKNTDLITIVDIWDENFYFFIKNKKNNILSKMQKPAVSFFRCSKEESF